MRKYAKTALAGFLLAASGLANAGMIDSKAVLLDDAGATLLEGWLGQGDLDWESVWYGGYGATSTSWHSVVDTITHTVSIYQAINSLGDSVLVGGYTANAWSSDDGVWRSDETAFLFNLTQPEYQAIGGPTVHSTFNRETHFASFGAGHDLYGGQYTMGTSSDSYYDGYVANASYDNTKGTIDVGNGDNVTYPNDSSFRVSALETYTFSSPSASASAVPEPASIAMLGLGISFLAFSRRKRKVKNQ